MERRLGAKRLLELGGLHSRQRIGIDGADAAHELERSREGLLDAHLLVERKPDQERHRIACNELVRLGVPGEMEGCRLRCGHDGDPIARR
jgi:hypothetical protein